MNDDLRPVTSVGSAPGAAGEVDELNPKGGTGGGGAMVKKSDKDLAQEQEVQLEAFRQKKGTSEKELSTSLRSIVDRLKARKLGGDAKRAAVQVAGSFKAYADNISVLMQDIKAAQIDIRNLRADQLKDPLKDIAFGTDSPRDTDSDIKIVDACHAVVNLIPAEAGELPVLGSADLWRAVTDLPHILACVYARLATDLTKDAYVHLVRRLTALGAAVGSPLYEAMMQSTTEETAQEVREQMSKGMIRSSLGISKVRACAFSSV